MKNRLLLSILALAFFTVGCFQVETTTTINKDGSAVRKMDIAFPAAMKEMLAMGDKSPKKDMENEGWSVEEKTDEDKYHIIGTKKFAKAEDITDDESTVTLEQKGSKLIYHETFKGKEAATKSSEEEEEGEEMGDEMIKSMMGGLQYTFILVMPGKISNSNADKVEGNKATWVFDVDKIFDEKVLDMHAEAAIGPAIGLPFWAILVIIAVVIIVVIAAIVKSKGKKQIPPPPAPEKKKTEDPKTE